MEMHAALKQELKTKAAKYNVTSSALVKLILTEGLQQI
jgi:hypothetical protein